MYLKLYMYEIVLMIFIFMVVLFCYVHIYDNYTTSNDLEVYDIDKGSKDKLEEICNLKQPFLFNFDENLITNTNLYGVTKHNDAFEINIRVNEKEKEETDASYNSNEVLVPLILEKAKELFNKEDNITYFTEDNADFLTESGLIKYIKYNDSYLRPYMVSNCFYDILSGSMNGYTPLRYDINNRNYYLVTNGYIEITLIPPKYSKYLYQQPDYELFEFKSPINVWDIQPNYKQEYNKSKSIRFTINTGKMLYIPPYWWYSIRFNKNSSVTTMKYRTFMNNFAILPNTILHYLQLYNIKRSTIENKRIFT
jgi:hypothetical protein